jgi:hypothetical protein
MTYSLIGACRTTHLKIMLVALIAASASVAAIGAAARPIGESLRDRLRLPAGVLAVASQRRFGCTDSYAGAPPPTTPQSPRKRWLVRC